MTTLRLTGAQKRKLEEARQVLEALEGDRVTQGEAVEFLAGFALEHRTDLARRQNPEKPSWIDDPLLDPEIGFDMGKTDERTRDRLLYGRR